MSIVVDRRAITPAQTELVTKFLWMTTTQKDNYSKANKFSKAKTIPFFIKKTLTRTLPDGSQESVDFIYLPLAFAIRLFGKTPAEFRKGGWPMTKWEWKADRVLRDYQVPFVKKAIDIILENNCVVLGAFMGFGKTLSSWYIATQLGGDALVVTNRKGLSEQWLKEGETSTHATINIVPDKAGMTRGLFNPDAQVHITMLDRWENIPPAILRRKRILILDEVHLLCVESAVPALLACQPEYIIACTATFEREDGMERMVKSMCGGDKCIIRPVFPKKFHIVGIKTLITIPEKMGANGRDWNACCDDVANSKECNQLILHFVRTLGSTKIMIFTRLVDHAKMLCQFMKDNGVSSDYLTGEKTRYSECQVLVATIQFAGTGFDAANFCNNYDGNPIEASIYAMTVKATNLAIQSAGRTWRHVTPKSYFLIHKHTTIKNHWAEIKKIFDNPEIFPKCQIEECTMLDNTFEAGWRKKVIRQAPE